MFERYTEKARRAIFFARYEASHLGSVCIETEHLLLGLFREDRALANRFLGSHTIESIRKLIEDRTSIREKVSTSVDLPLSHESKRVLVYGAEEATRLNHKHVGTAHLLLGLFREEKTFAAQLLQERGLTSDWVRMEVEQSEARPAQSGAGFVSGLDQWLAGCEARSDIWIANQHPSANDTTHFAIYVGGLARQNEVGIDKDSAEKLWPLQKRIASIVVGIENSIANHEFEKARFYSDEERKERENLHLIHEQFNLAGSPSPVPILCVEIIRDNLFSDVRGRCDAYITEGAALVWILDPHDKRAYTVTEAEGLREFKGTILKIAEPPLEMDLKKIFD